MPEFDTEFSDIAPPAGDADNGNLAAVWDGLHADQPNGSAHEQAMPAIDAPNSWPAQEKARWGSLSPELQAHIARREKEAQDAISRGGQERKQLQEQYEAARKQAEQFTPLSQLLDQHKDTFQHYGMTAHQTVESLLRMERMLRTDPNAVTELAKAYGRELPTAEHVGTLQTQLFELKQSENKRVLDEFIKGKDYFGDTNFQSAVAAEMRELQKAAPGLMGDALLRLAHDRVAERAGIPQQLEQKRETEQQQRITEQRQRELALQDRLNREAKQLLAENDHRWATQIAESEAKRQRENQEKTRMAKRAAAVNTKGSPGHGTNPRTMDATLREIANRAYG